MTDAVLERLQALSDRVDEYRVRQRSEMQRLSHDIDELRTLIQEREPDAIHVQADTSALADELRVFKAATAQQLTEVTRALSAILTEMGNARSHTVVTAPPPQLPSARPMAAQARELGNAVLSDLRARWKRR